MRKTSLIFTLASLSLLGACFFVDKEIYDVVPVADDPPVVSVISNLDTLNQAFVGDSLEVFYEFSIVNGELYFIDAIVSDDTFYSSDSAQGSFWIYPFQSSGLDSLILEFYHSSNTNTLADKAGYEALITSRSYAIDFGEEGTR